MEAFWEPDGAQFLISTSAGGEGINLQCARILFNYDLPWNPMRVEQRIGRVHRLGQELAVEQIRVHVRRARARERDPERDAVGAGLCSDGLDTPVRAPEPRPIPAA